MLMLMMIVRRDEVCIGGISSYHYHHDDDADVNADADDEVEKG